MRPISVPKPPTVPGSIGPHERLAEADILHACIRLDIGDDRDLAPHELRRVCCVETDRRSDYMTLSIPNTAASWSVLSVCGCVYWNRPTSLGWVASFWNTASPRTRRLGLLPVLRTAAFADFDIVHRIGDRVRQDVGTGETRLVRPLRRACQRNRHSGRIVRCSGRDRSDLVLLVEHQFVHDGAEWPIARHLLPGSSCALRPGLACASE
jgi:hypothetical protein